MLYVWQVVESSRKLGLILHALNATFLTLVPKMDKHADPSNFRPIALCNVIYKIITKIIANRIKNLLPAFIPEIQGGFVKGRHIEENIILVQEAIHSSIHRKEKGMIFKLYLANAFEMVHHEFLFQVLHKFGFNSLFIKWVQACISNPWIAPLVNGRAVGFFQASRGLRQGCPLSPLLYAIQASVLSFQLSQSQRH